MTAIATFAHQAMPKPSTNSGGGNVSANCRDLSAHAVEQLNETSRTVQTQQTEEMIPINDASNKGMFLYKRTITTTVTRSDDKCSEQEKTITFENMSLVDMSTHDDNNRISQNETIMVGDKQYIVMKVTKTTKRTVSNATDVTMSCSDRSLNESSPSTGNNSFSGGGFLADSFDDGNNIDTEAAVVSTLQRENNVIVLKEDISANCVPLSVDPAHEENAPTTEIEPVPLSIVDEAKVNPNSSYLEVKSDDDSSDDDEESQSDWYADILARIKEAAKDELEEPEATDSGNFSMSFLPLIEINTTAKTEPSTESPPITVDSKEPMVEEKLAVPQKKKFDDSSSSDDSEDESESYDDLLARIRGNAQPKPKNVPVSASDVAVTSGTATGKKIVRDDESDSSNSTVEVKVAKQVARKSVQPDEVKKPLVADNFYSESSSDADRLLEVRKDSTSFHQSDCNKMNYARRNTSITAQLSDYNNSITANDDSSIMDFHELNERCKEAAEPLQPFNSSLVGFYEPPSYDAGKVAQKSCFKSTTERPNKLPNIVWADGNSIFYIPLLVDIPADVVSMVWWSPEEMTRLKQEYEGIVYMVETGKPIDEEYESARGLEIRTEEGEWVFYQNKRNAWNAVLGMQEDIERDPHCIGTQSKDDAISNAYKQESANQTRDDAIQRAFCDRELIEEYIKI